MLAGVGILVGVGFSFCICLLVVRCRGISLVVSVSGFVLLLCGVVDILQEILVRQVFRDFAIRLGRCSSRSVADVKSFSGFLWRVADACRVIAGTAAVEAYSDDEGRQGSNAADCCQHHLIPLVVELGVAVHLYYCDGVVVVVSALGESQSVHFARYASHHICCLSLGGEEFQQLLVRHASPHAISAEDEPVALAIAHLFDIRVVVGLASETFGYHVGLGRDASLLFRHHLLSHQFSHERMVLRAEEHQSAVHPVAAAVAGVAYYSRFTVDEYRHHCGSHAAQLLVGCHCGVEGIVGFCHGDAQSLFAWRQLIAGVQMSGNLLFGYRRGGLASRSATHSVADHEEEAKRRVYESQVVLVFFSSALHGVGSSV